MNDLATLYPSAPDIIGHMERRWNERMWKMSRLLGPEETNKQIRESLIELVAMPNIDDGARRALAQLDTDDFKRYLSARLGCL